MQSDAGAANGLLQAPLALEAYGVQVKQSVLSTSRAPSREQGAKGGLGSRFFQQPKTTARHCGHRNFGWQASQRSVKGPLMTKAGPSSRGFGHEWWHLVLAGTLWGCRVLEVPSEKERGQHGRGELYRDEGQDIGRIDTGEGIREPARYGDGRVCKRRR